MTSFGSSPADDKVPLMTHPNSRSTAVWRLLLCGVCVALVMGGAVVFGPAVAASKFAPVGTEIRYTDRYCTIIASRDDLVQCRLESGEIYARASGLEIVGPLTPQGDFLTFLSRTSCRGPVARVREIEISDRAAQKLASLWPLAVGKSVSYPIIAVTNGGFGDNEANGDFYVKATVESRENVTTPGGTFDAFKIVQIARASCAANRTTNTVRYERTFWFASDPGVLVKESMAWTMGPLYGSKAASELVSLRLSGPVPVAAAPPPPKPKTEAAKTEAAKTEAPKSETPKTETPKTETPDRPQQVAQKPEQTATRKSEPLQSLSGLHFGRYHALVVGNNAYDDLDALKTAVADATAVAGILRQDYGFEVTLLTNATRASVVKALADYRRDLKTDDNLLIYYAGHGVLDQVTEQGYWLPVDAARDDPTNWIDVNSVTNMIRA
ncbi:MAG: caspase family protein, partial [Proteobacteria bacterium]|nr:caspase family protein [Pseudomonadota bacterium]